VVDGTGLSMPDTSANQKVFPQSSSMKPGCGFPQIKLTGLFSLANGTMLGYAIGKLKESEITLWKSLWKLMKKGDIILGDRAFGSYANTAALLQKGVDSVMRLHQGREKNLDLTQGKKLGKNDVIMT
jgi:Transposase DDE domain